MARNYDPDERPHDGSTLFAHACRSQYLGLLRLTFFFSKSLF